MDISEGLTIYWVLCSAGAKGTEAEATVPALSEAQVGGSVMDE